MILLNWKLLRLFLTNLTCGCFHAMVSIAVDGYNINLMVILHTQHQEGQISIKDFF